MRQAFLAGTHDPLTEPSDMSALLLRPVESQLGDLLGNQSQQKKEERGYEAKHRHVRQSVSCVVRVRVVAGAKGKEEQAERQKYLQRRKETSQS